MTPVLRLSLLWFALSSFACVPAAMSQTAGQCMVLDPELQGSYAGGCRDGLAEGPGNARGIAEYRGEFHAGRKHGKGVKSWPEGDRYEGDFVDDQKEGFGTYIWSTRGSSAGERYTGAYRADRRNGFGTYTWPNGDVYAGPWANDQIVGALTPNMMARARAEMELRNAVAKPGAKVCRKMTIGIASTDWIRGTVMAVEADRIAVRIDDPGQFFETIGNTPIAKGITIRDAISAWAPCA